MTAVAMNPIAERERLLCEFNSPHAPREFEALFRLIWDNSQDGLRLTNEAGVMIMVNDAFCRMVGRTREELLGRPFAIIHGESDTAPAVRQARKRADSKGNELLVEKELILWNGRRTWFEISNTMMECSDSRRLLLSVFKDISEKKRLEGQLLRAQRMESIGALAGGIAHDLNNILAPITVAAQMLRMKPLDEETEQLLTRMETSAQRGADVVRQVLTFARGIEGERTLLQPRRVINEVLKIAKETFPRTILISSRLAGDLWPMLGDATQFHQVLLNLCLNARDAMPGGGNLQVTADNLMVDDAGSVAEGCSPGPYLLLQVKDTGAGIDPANLEKIFEPFFTTKKVGQGTGLGLSTALGIVKSHGGQIKAYSEVGQGSIFKVHLPATPNAPTTRAPQSFPGLPAGRGELILLVDDESGIRDVGRKVLIKHGYNVLTAADGAEAVALFAEQPGRIHLVLTDIMMPRMEGFALIRALRKTNPHLKIIATSGLPQAAGQADRTAELESLGVQHFLQKPFSAEKLLGAIHQLLNNPV